jgi:hypothetical protein
VWLIAGLKEPKNRKMKRNRIVINLDQAPAGGARRARGGSGIGRVLIIIVVVLLLVCGGVAGGGYFWWRHYQNSPAYSLALLVDASQRNDTATIDSILDTDKVSEDFVSQVRQRSAGSITSAIGSVWPTQADSTLSSLTPKLKQTIHDEFVKELKRLTEPAAGRPFVLVALAITRFADIKEENNIAHAAVNIKDEHLQLTMQPATTPGRWRITAVQDDKLATVIADSVKQNLPSTGAQVQDEIHKQIDKLKKHAP